MPELVFAAPRADADLAAALAAEVDRQDAAGQLAAGFPEPRPDRVYVTLGASRGGEPGEPLSARTIVVLTAPPGSERFAAEIEPARRAGGVFHVNAEATQRLLEVGVPARHLQLGYSPVWEAASAGDAEVVAIAGCGGYFDWVGALRAVHAGAAVVHEDARGLAPLVPNRHLVCAAPAELDAAAAALADDRERLDLIRAEALEFLRTALPLELAAAALIGMARTLVAQPLPVGVAPTPGQPVSRSK